MRQAKKVAGLGLKALLALVGGVAAMFGVGTSACAAYGPKQCILEFDCPAGEHCRGGVCEPAEEPDAGTSAH